MTDHQTDPHEDRPDTGYETTDADAKPIAYAFAGLAVLIVVVFVAVWGFFVYMDRRTYETEARAGQIPEPDFRVPEPRLQSTPEHDLKRMLQHEQSMKESYGWVNEASGIVRIPIERAMDIVAEKGLPNLPPIGEEEGTPDTVAAPATDTLAPQTGATSPPPPAAGRGQPSSNTPQSRTGSTSGEQSPRN
jgi:hypothetical protein